MAQFARVVDTRLGAHDNSTIKYVVEQGAQNVSYNPLTSSSHSNQSTTFNLNNISQYVARDSRLNISLTATISLVLVNSTGASINAVNSDNFGARQFSLNRAVSSIQHKINSASYTLQTGSILDALGRLNMVSQHANFYDNTQPDCVDDFANATGSILSPLQSYTSTGTGNGMFKPRTLNYSVVGSNSVPANSTATITIQYNIYEPIISPFNNIGDENSEALYGINGELIQLFYYANLFDCMFNYVAPTGLTVSASTSVSLGNSATLQAIYLTAYPETQKEIPHTSLYHYNDYQQFQNDIGSFAPGQVKSGLSSQVTTFTNIPQKILVYARVSDGSKTASMPDNYCVFNNITITFDNGQPMLSGASQNQLWEISNRNGLTMERANWLGKVLNPSLVASGLPAIHGCGSVLVIDPAIDLGLRADNTNGSSGRFVMQVINAVMQNNTSQNFPSTTLFVVGIASAILERNGTEYRNYILSLPDDVFEKAKEIAPVSLALYNKEKFTNLFLSGGGIGDWFKKALNFGKNAVKKVVSLAKDNPDMVNAGLQLLNQHLNKDGGRLKMIKGAVRKGGAKDVHPKKNMDLYFE